MATWSELKQYIHSKYQVSEDLGDAVRLVFNVAGGRTQNVVVAGQRAGAYEYMVMWTPVCQESEISARDALGRNAGMALGALALMNGTIILRHTSPLKDLDPDEFDVPLRGLTMAGDLLEQQLAVVDRF